VAEEIDRVAQNDVEPALPTQTGCSCANIAVLVFLGTGGMVGFVVGQSRGLGWGLLGVVAGALVGFFTLVILVGILGGGAFLFAKVMGWDEADR
jgi:hypothetical protein